MRHITTFEYICLLFTHNIRMAFHKLQMVFYRIFDFFEESWWVYVTPKKSKGDYHLFKLGQNMAQSGKSESGLPTTVLLFMLLETLQYTKEEQHTIGFVFYPAAYLRFMIDRELLDQMTIVCSVKNREDILDAGDLLGFGFRNKFQVLYGFAALIEYENQPN